MILVAVGGPCDGQTVHWNERDTEVRLIDHPKMKITDVKDLASEASISLNPQIAYYKVDTIYFPGNEKVYYLRWEEWTGNMAINFLVRRHAREANAL